MRFHSCIDNPDNDLDFRRYSSSYVVTFAVVDSHVHGRYGCHSQAIDVHPTLLDQFDCVDNVLVVARRVDNYSHLDNNPERSSSRSENV